MRVHTFLLIVELSRRDLAFHSSSSLSPSKRIHIHPSNGMQIDNHVPGHKLPVMFCFREGGRLVQANEAGRGGDGEEAKAGCRFTMSLVSWRRLRPLRGPVMAAVLNPSQPFFFCLPHLSGCITQLLMFSKLKRKIVACSHRMYRNMSLLHDFSRDWMGLAQASFVVLSQVLAESWEHSRVPSYLEKVALRSAPIDVCFEDSLLPPLLVLLERAG